MFINKLLVILAITALNLVALSNADEEQVKRDPSQAQQRDCSPNNKGSWIKRDDGYKYWNCAVPVNIKREQPVKRDQIYKQEPICNRSNSHCIYVTGTARLGGVDGTPIRCQDVDYKQGLGLGACQYPDKTSGIKVYCTGSQRGTVTVGFSSAYSYFEVKGYAQGIWSSERSHDRSHRSGKPFTTEAGDDLYITCGN